MVKRPYCHINRDIYICSHVGDSGLIQIFAFLCHRSRPSVGGINLSFVSYGRLTLTFFHMMGIEAHRLKNLRYLQLVCLNYLSDLKPSTDVREHSKTIFLHSTTWHQTTWIRNNSTRRCI